MQLIRYSPLREMQRMQRDIDKFWGNGFSKALMTDSSILDMYEENGKLVTEITLPNFSKDEIKVSIDNGVLEITAEHREEEKKEDKKHYYFRESSNQFSRRVVLPEGVDTIKPKAEFKDGILKIIMNMTEKPEVKHIEIK